MPLPVFFPLSINSAFDCTRIVETAENLRARFHIVTAFGTPLRVSVTTHFWYGVLNGLGEEPVWEPDTADRFATDSKPVTSAKGALPLEQIVAALDQTQARLESALERLSAEDLARVVEGQEATTGDRLAGLYWHEAYHAGQTEYLRQLAGKDDKVI